MIEPIGMFGAAVYVFAYFWYAVGIMRHGAGDVSPVTMLMWEVLDVLALFATIDAEKPIWLPLGYVIGTFIVMVALFARGTWAWSYRETICLIGAIIATTVWRTSGSSWGLFACAAALVSAGIPMFIDMVKKPVRGTWPLWTSATFACVCALVMSDGSMAGTVVAWSGIIFCVPLTVIVLRGK